MPGLRAARWQAGSSRKPAVEGPSGMISVRPVEVGEQRPQAVTHPVQDVVRHVARLVPKPFVVELVGIGHAVPWMYSARCMVMIAAPISACASGERMCHASDGENGSGRRDQNATWSGNRLASPPRRAGLAATAGAPKAARKPAPKMAPKRLRRLVRLAGAPAATRRRPRLRGQARRPARPRRRPARPRRQPHGPGSPRLALHDDHLVIGHDARRSCAAGAISRSVASTE